MRCHNVPRWTELNKQCWGVVSSRGEAPYTIVAMSDEKWADWQIRGCGIIKGGGGGVCVYCDV